MVSDDGVYVCAECGAITDTVDDSGEHNVEQICCCGLTIAGGKDARFRCVTVPAEQRTLQAPYMLAVVRV
ncbi:hypothetical protein [Methylocaldum sp.]|uniref:hypothetical protein n=1 Tax=Methylocaldum sp. TaxID=1969727 RepID=UPI002D2284A0|nr:hypothetical protein [Methylocaldum sp.]HYE36132.1 hypothetical protein [Methylocaldum sp.]